MEVVRVRGIPIAVGTIGDAVDVVESWVNAKAGSMYVCCAPVHLIEVAQHDAAVDAALQGAAMVLPDGAPVAWVARRSARRPAHRITGSDVFDAMCGRSVGTYRHFFYGSTDDVLARLEESVRARFPGILICGSHSPPFRSLSPAERSSELALIQAARPDIVWVGLGAPKQDLWMAGVASTLNGPVLIGVGAVFDFVAGTKKRAPRAMQTAGLEWLHRLASEPRRLLRRYAVTNVTFALGVFRDAFRSSREP
jgi:N-acetylglucosaminyldiphosphoundecaprenol N-acetyl-beta-D-mannosaminyltransferase